VEIEIVGSKVWRFFPTLATRHDQVHRPFKSRVAVARAAKFRSPAPTQQRPWRTASSSSVGSQPALARLSDSSPSGFTARAFLYTCDASDLHYCSDFAVF